MRTQLIVRAIIRPLLAATLGLAITFTFSCSDDKDDDTPVPNPAPAISSSGGGSSSSGGGSSSGGLSLEQVVIGSQTWMKKNLSVAAAGSKCYGEGGKVFVGLDEETYTEIFATLSDAEVQANCNKYGRLYDWATAMGLDASCNSSSCASQIQAKHKGICPTSWHIPNDDEWDALMTAVGGSSTAGKHLKAESGWNEGGDGEDTYGFAALPGGNGYSGSRFMNASDYGFWWSASESNAYDGHRLYMSYRDEQVYWDNYRKNDLHSVRCVRN
jgi:uncharacterized protein (TIGR02145 family)